MAVVPFFFDVTESLRESPVEVWFCRFEGNLIAVGLLKTEDFVNRSVAAMWEVENGLHLRESLVVMACTKPEEKSALSKMLGLVAHSKFDAEKIKIERHSFTGKKNSDFWELIEQRGLGKLVVKDRLVLRQDIRDKVNRERQSART